MESLMSPFALLTMSVSQRIVRIIDEQRYSFPAYIAIIMGMGWGGV
jgi:hypothetical protein